MSSGVRVHLDAFGDTAAVPVKVEVLDQTLKPVQSAWVDARASREFTLAPGLYGVRASVSSGGVIEQAVEVVEGAIEDCRVPLHELSPHETQEWAYLTAPIDAPGRELLCDARYEGVWMRLFRRGPNGSWSVVPVPIDDPARASWEEDGVSYRFRAGEDALQLLQLGGPKVPWKIVALPPSYEVMVLVRPTSGPPNRVHPLDVVVSSEQVEIETLLALLQRGDTARARDYMDESRLAEQLLFEKGRNTAGAAVGGYFLLRVGDLPRLHNWANNLANWFEWMADGPVIHAWQLIHRAKQAPAERRTSLERARERLLEAASRGVPLYSEGLRLLRDGLLLFDRQAKGTDQEVRQAAARFGDFAAVADWSSIATSFTGEHPDRPSGTPRRGTPRPGDDLLYVFDVPLAAALRRGAIDAGAELTADLENRPWRCRLDPKGRLELGDGRSYRSVGAIQRALAGSSSGAWWSWRFAASDETLWTATQKLRLSPHL